MLQTGYTAYCPLRLERFLRRNRHRQTNSCASVLDFTKFKGINLVANACFIPMWILQLIAREYALCERVHSIRRIYGLHCYILCLSQFEHNHLNTQHNSLYKRTSMVTLSNKFDFQSNRSFEAKIDYLTI